MPRPRGNHLSRGVESELRVALDLVERGWDVFSPVVGAPADCDLVAVSRTTGRCVRVEVKTCAFVHQRADGSGLAYANAPPPHKRHKHDTVAFVLRDGSIRYVPDMIGQEAFVEARQSA